MIVNNILKRTVLFACILISSSYTVFTTELKVAKIFSEDMIIQRDAMVPVWGWANSGEKITVTFAGQKVSTIADKKGQWMVKLKPMKTSFKGKTLTIKGSKTIKIGGVLVGEVWLCGGQSNMEATFDKEKGSVIDPAELKKDLSGLRFHTGEGKWQIPDKDNQYVLSKVSYYFGMKLYREIKSPIGLIIRATSGTTIQSWMPEKKAKEIQKKLNIAKYWHELKLENSPAYQYNLKLKDVIPVAMKGAIWYQGESNRRIGWEYRYLLPHLINTWRELWAKHSGENKNDFSFYYIQVPCQNKKPGWAWLRDSMRRVLDTTKNTGMAVYYDHGPEVHPTNKRPAGERLALWALAKDYGRKNLVYSGPLLKNIQLKGGKAILDFAHKGEGLKNVSGGKVLDFFEIAGLGGNYYKAIAIIQKNKVIVTSEQVKKPSTVRYLFHKKDYSPVVSLVNSAGLPASPFMTDDSKPKWEPYVEMTEEEFLAAREKKARLKAKQKMKKKKKK